LRQLTILTRWRDTIGNAIGNDLDANAIPHNEEYHESEIRRSDVELQQLEVPGYMINLRGFIWPNCKTGSRRLAVKLGSTPIRDQMNLKSHFDGFVVNRHQLLFAIAANAYLRKGTHNPGLLVGREIIDANR
jgi:hypothetical protein